MFISIIADNVTGVDAQEVLSVPVSGAGQVSNDCQRALHSAIIRTDSCITQIDYSIRLSIHPPLQRLPKVLLSKKEGETEKERERGESDKLESSSRVGCPSAVALRMLAVSGAFTPQWCSVSL